MCLCFYVKMDNEKLPDGYFTLLQMNEREKRAILSGSGSILATGDINSVEPPFFGCVCVNDPEPCYGCTTDGCAKLC